MGKTHDYDPNGDKQRQYSIAKHVGCKFVVKVICPDNASRHIEIWVNPNHTSHEPGSNLMFFFTATSKRN